MIMHTRHVPGLAVLLAAVLLPLSCSKDSPPEAPPRAQPESVRDTSGQPPAPVAETETPPAPVAKSGPPARKVPEPPEGREVRPPEPVLPGGEKTPPPPKAEPGLRLEVGPGKPPVDAPQREKQADAKRLSDADAAKVLARLPKLVEEAGDAASFAFRKRSLPPPRTGETVKTAFPPQAPADATRPDGGTAQPLEVVRFAPEGDVKLAPHLSVTFSQPMVAVTSHEEVKGDLPVAFSPKVEGKWRWVGTQTILFEPTKRFPMASELTVTVPKGTTSKSGGVLAGDVTWTFRTPPPRVIGGWPTGGPHGLDPVFFMELDQHVDPKKVLETVVVTAGWSKVPIRLATEAETKAGNPPPMVSDEARKGRWVAFRAESALPKDKSISVKVGPGTPSEEGPRKTEEAHTWSFRTFGPFRVEEKQCGWRRCPPMHPFTIRMSNPFDAEAFDAEQVSVEPKVEGLNVSVSGQYLHVRGLTKGRTKYTVTLDKGIVDSFGQALGENERVVFEVGEADPWMAAQGGVFVVLDPQSGPTYPIYTVNERRVELTLYRVGP